MTGDQPTVPLEVVITPGGDSVDDDALTENTNPIRVYYTEKELIAQCVKDKLFRKQKFIDRSRDLSFSNRPNSICRYLAVEFDVPDHSVETWWRNMAGFVHGSFKNHRNSAIKAIQKNYTSTL
jgi:hypothetical protein